VIRKGSSVRSGTRRFATAITLAAALCTAASALAQTVKIGMLATYSGPGAAYGEQMERGMRLYMKQNADQLPRGVKVELVVRDDGGPLPDKAKALAQELIVRDKVQLLTGFVWSPNALAIAPLATEAKVPMVIMNAAASVITTRSPYAVRFSFTEWQHAYTIGQWAAKKYKRAYVLVSDFAPGHDAETAFSKSFTEGGGQIAGTVRTPIQSLNYAPYLQRVRDEKPEVLFVFVPAGQPATAVVKTFADLGLAKAGVKLIGSGNIASDEELDNMGDAVLGVVTAYHYSPTADRPANKAFTAAFAKEYGEKVVPTLMTVAAWDAMDAIYGAIRAQNGRLDPDKTMQILSHYKNAKSPRGPIAIDPETRDVVHNEYIRETRRVGGHIVNVELETIPDVKDPWKEMNRKK
jgi:branched-chain amino acid transport system substrate-binding protein